MVFPVIAADISQLSLFNIPATDVDGDVFILMCVFE